MGTRNRGEKYIVTQRNLLKRYDRVKLERSKQIKALLVRCFCFGTQSNFFYIQIYKVYLVILKIRISSKVMKLLFCSVLFVVFFTSRLNALDNGLALTPPMGWLAWERFRCNTDCQNDPDNCISEDLFKTMADIIATEGYAQIGYDTVIMDDCWLSHERDADDYGNFTCAGYPGMLGNTEIDANTFAEWTVDYIKVDGCYDDPSNMDVGFPEFGYYLNQTGRPIVYSCEWPLYQSNANYTAIRETCNLWRNYHDIEDSWDSVQDIINFYGNDQEVFASFAGPGGWNDPDMLVIGNFGLSYEQSKSQMAIWAIFAAPLIMSVDLRTIKSDYKAILQNAAVIAAHTIDIWTKPVSPVYDDSYSYAIAFQSRRTDGMPYKLTVTLEELGLTDEAGYEITELFDGVNYGTLLPSDSFSVDFD
ncbi:hypothetical protein Avbf_00113 [Armadillidium vulgare]|nr:hypothetical protein Avbf_00113 [Armadillidium vulgare]